MSSFCAQELPALLVPSSSVSISLWMGDTRNVCHLHGTHLAAYHGGAASPTTVIRMRHASDHPDPHLTDAAWIPSSFAAVRSILTKGWGWDSNPSLCDWKVCTVLYYTTYRLPPRALGIREFQSCRSSQWSPCSVNKDVGVRAIFHSGLCRSAMMGAGGGPRWLLERLFLGMPGWLSR